jgi:hypothetical protein
MPAVYPLDDLRKAGSRPCLGELAFVPVSGTSWLQIIEMNLYCALVDGLWETTG